MTATALKYTKDKFSPGQVLQVQIVTLGMLVGVTIAIDDIAIVVGLHCWKFSVVKRTKPRKKHGTF